MQCIFLDRINSDYRVDRDKTTCKTGFENYTPVGRNIEICLYDDNFLKCPRFIARTMINNQKIQLPVFTPNNEKSNEIEKELRRENSETQCIFLDLEQNTRFIKKHDCKTDFQKYEVPSSELETYCLKKNFLNCPRFEAILKIYNLNLQVPTSTVGLKS